VIFPQEFCQGLAHK